MLRALEVPGDVVALLGGTAAEATGTPGRRRCPVSVVEDRTQQILDRLCAEFLLCGIDAGNGVQDVGVAEHDHRSGDEVESGDFGRCTRQQPALAQRIEQRSDVQPYGPTEIFDQPVVPWGGE